MWPNPTTIALLVLGTIVWIVTVVLLFYSLTATVGLMLVFLLLLLIWVWVRAFRANP